MNNDAPNSRLLERIARGDQSAVREVIDRYADLVWSLVRRSIRSDHDAEEAVQEIFTELWQKACRYDRSIGEEATFVSVLTRRALINRWRRTHRTPDSAELADDHAEDLGRAPALDRTDDAAAALAVFAELPLEQQRVLRLSIVNGHSHEAIAQITSLPLGTVKTHARRGLSRIRAALAAGLTRSGAPR